MNDKALIIIPTYDERENVEPMAEAVLKQVPEANILFVDDNSPDGTGALWMIGARAASFRAAPSRQGGPRPRLYRGL